MGYPPGSTINCIGTVEEKMATTVLYRGYLGVIYSMLVGVLEMVAFKMVRRCRNSCKSAGYHYSVN